MRTHCVHNGWMGLVLVGAFLLGGCATSKDLGHASHARIRGTVLDDRDGTPMQWVRVIVCAPEPQAPVRRFDLSAPCSYEEANTSTDTSGGFDLVSEAETKIRSGANIVFSSPGFLPETIPIAALPSGSLKIRLRPAATLDVTIVDVEGNLVSKVGVGWLKEQPETILTRFERFHDLRDGKVSIIVPEGKLTLFSMNREGLPSFGTGTVTTKAGGQYAVTLRTEKPLLAVRGRVETADGDPLAAVVSVEPVDILSALDRVLLDLQDQSTDLLGHFIFRLTTPNQVKLRLSTWLGLGTEPTHVRMSPLTEAKAQFALPPNHIVLRAQGAPVVRCTMQGPSGAAIALSEIGLSFAPHRQSGHSGSCVLLGGHADADDNPNRAYAQEVRFIWPKDAEALLLTAQGVERSSTEKSNPSHYYQGERVLKSANDVCQIRGN